MSEPDRTEHDLRLVELLDGNMRDRSDASLVVDNGMPLISAPEA
jgi:hypothetical protein